MNRRQAIAGTVAGAAMLAAASEAGGETAQGQGATFVLVHGAWHGGWCWRDVVPLLQVRGARVFTPTLTGLAERAHLRTPTPTLSTHIEDVARLIECEELQNVVLVGHSYGGMVITGVADRLASRLRHLVYLDAAVPDDGETMITQMPGISRDEARATEAQIRSFAAGDWLPPFPPAMLGVPESDSASTAWLTRRMTPHPLPTWLEPIRLPNGAARLPSTFILCTAPILPQSAVAEHAARIRADRSGRWRYRELATGHEAMVTAPRQTADLLLEAAT